MLEYLDLFMFVVLMLAIMSGFPVAFSVLGVAILFAFLGYFTGTLQINRLGALGQRMFGIITNQILIAIPLFILMGIILERSQIAKRLLTTMGQMFGKIHGGLAISVIFVGALLAASTGVVGATVIAMGMIALPSMLQAGYQGSFSAGLICSAGTLGQIIPPSTLLIILADVMSSAYQQAQYAQGKFTISTISVGQLFAAALLPGLLLVLLYTLYAFIKSYRIQTKAPENYPDPARFPPIKMIFSAVLPPLLLIITVLGAILGGVATPTEAAAVGAIGALLLSGLTDNHQKSRYWIIAGILALVILLIAAKFYPVRFQRSDLTDWQRIIGYSYILLAVLGFLAILLSIYRLWIKKDLTVILDNTMSITAMIFTTVLTASVFSLVFIGLGGEAHIKEILHSMPGGQTGALLFSMLLIFVLGFFLDFVEISVILLPLLAPALMMLGLDPIWLSILIAMNLQTSFLTPPFGFSLFYFRGVAPKSLRTTEIYRGVLPFIILQIFAILLVACFPKIATWLPTKLF